MSVVSAADHGAGLELRVTADVQYSEKVLWMESEGIMVNKVSLTQKHKCHVLSFSYAEAGNSGLEYRIVITRGQGRCGGCVCVGYMKMDQGRLDLIRACYGIYIGYIP